MWRLCRLGEAPTPLPCVAVEPPETPFTTKKEISAGEIQKNKTKGFSGGASAGLPAQALGLSLHGSAALAGDKMDFFSSLAGDEGFEPPITGPEPVALPLGQSPLM